MKKTFADTMFFAGARRALPLLALLMTSCTHWVIDTTTRIQVRNNTGESIYDFSVISETEQIIVLVPEIIEAGSDSKVREVEWVGKNFNFVIFTSDGTKKNLGIHKLKGGSVLAQIDEDFVLVFK
ncbi:MAG: hypothetical protein LBC85_04290 [Fibromonadaceae bacterium]|jgi:hypothetical protein|nr:hypothetical protein [Fibromonadaceae bacterium]